MNKYAHLLRAVALAALATGCGQAAAATYHVDCSANGPEAGLENPVRSLEALNQIQFAPGSRILFKRGSTCYGTFKPAAGSSGRPGAPIVVDAYGPADLPRPVIAAGCTQSRRDPDQSYTETGKPPSGVSPYRSLCTADDGPARRAALHLFNVEQWEINSLELTNDGLAEGPRVGLLVQLEDFGTGTHYRINDVYVHHVRGYLKDAKGQLAYKQTGGVLFDITRNTGPGGQPKQSKFDDVLIENSEVYHVDAIGISNRSAWMCRVNGAPCGDYLKAGETPAAHAGLAERTPIDFYPSTRLVIRNNKIHDIGGDGIIVRTATAPLVESNLLYDVWMRAPGNSAGAWAINTDDALFQYNEVHGVRMRENMADGMAFDADLGTWGTVVRNNYSHDNQGGLMLYCGCGADGMGNWAKAAGALVENNLSVNDSHRIVLISGAEGGVVKGNLIVTNKPGLDVMLVEAHRNQWKDEVAFIGNVVLRADGAGKMVRISQRSGSVKDLSWSGNTFAGYPGAPDFADVDFKPGTQANRTTPASAQDAAAAIARWFAASGFAAKRYRSAPRP